MLKKILSYSCSVIFIFLLWELLARKINAELILPYPDKVFSIMFKLFQNTNFWKAFMNTFIRVIISFCFSVFLGSLIGWIRTISSFFKNFFEIPLSIIRSTPVMALILVVMFWFSSDSLPIFVAVLMALPVISTSVFQGLHNKDKSLLLMANVYNFSKYQIFKYIKLPHLLPHFYSGCQSCFGLCWKVVVAGEIMSLPKNGFGTMLSNSQVHLETAEVMAIAIVLVLVSYILEVLLHMGLKNGK